VDDHAIVRAGIGLMLKKIPGIQVIGEAGTGWSGVKLARQLKPHLVILDLQLPDISGLEVTQRLLKTNPELKILILTAAVHDSVSHWLQSAGAHAYLPKSASVNELKRTLEIIFADSTRDLPSPPNKNSLFNHLSIKEIEIMQMMIRDQSIADIARQLCLDPKTVYDYRCQIFKKTKVKNTVALARLALQQGIIDIVSVK